MMSAVYSRQHRPLFARLVPTNRAIPSIYLHRARQLINTRQPLYLFPLPAAPNVQVLAEDRQHVSITFEYDPSLKQRRIFDKCPACNRPCYSAKPLLYRPVCSPACALACHHFLLDQSALHGLGPSARFKITPIKQLFLRRPTYRQPDYRPSLSRYTLPSCTSKVTLAGQLANEKGLAYASILLSPPHHLIRQLAYVMTGKTPPAIKKAPALPVASFENPVSQRATEIVLGHLETANDVLSLNAPDPEKPHRQWNKEQVRLFLGLFNRVVPSLSAQINLNETPPAKDPSEMSREELEERAQSMKTIDATPNPEDAT